jgi:hypothetical protein
MAMADLFKPPLLGAWLRAADTFPVQRFHGGSRCHSARDQATQ